MRKLIQTINPDKKYQNYLTKWESYIKGVTHYSKRVDVAKEKWASRRQTKTLKHVCLKLEEMCSGNRRCCYCEDSVADEVEHIKPKSLFPELTFTWSNYLYACGSCNINKNNKYALFIAGVLTSIISSTVPPNPGHDVFINPRQDDPMSFLDLDLGQTIEDGTFWYLPKHGLSPRGIDYQRADYTINTLGLNRDFLVEGRRNAALDFKARLYEYRQEKPNLSPQKLAQFQQDFQQHTYPSVWAHMKAQHQSIPVLNNFFQQFPEIHSW
ncbi:HNH endonuclease [Halomicronema sp. CCY15110]|uniref:HNH endonuclease n=1 Tax=Halomicronema sp. CCY15110 TaxID=2767773 RepID=UPI001951B0C7|nr:HNH endonuclease [Halomicronema sp. CCY15110]